MAEFTRRVSDLVPDAITQSYTRQLAAIFLLVVLVVSGVAGVQYAATASALNEDARSGLQAAAERQAIQVEQWETEHRRLVATISGDTSVNSVMAERSNGALAQYMESAPEDVTGLYLLDLESGTVAGSSDTDAVGETLFPGGEVPVSEDADLTDTNTIHRTAVYTRDGRSYVAFVKRLPSMRPRAVVVVADATALGDRMRANVDDSFTQLVTTDGTVVYGTGGGAPGRDYPAAETDAFAAATTGESGVSAQDAVGGFTANPHLVGYATLDSGETVLLHAERASVLSLSRRVGTDMAAVIGLSLLGFLGLGALLHVNTVRPLRGLSGSVSRLRDGELDVDLSTDRSDEFGDVLSGVAKLRDDLRDQRGDAHAYSDVMVRAADGDLTARLDEDSDSEDMRTIAVAYNEMMDEVEATVRRTREFADDVSALVTRVAENAEEVNHASQEVSTAIEQISAGATEQSDNLVAVSGEVNDLSASVEEIASSADELLTLADRATEEGHDGERAAEDALRGIDDIRTETERTVEEVRELDRQLGEIGDIVEVITEIADQTDVLALNANIEAARAGEAGEGFAVVSNEVKSLAQETKSSAADIAALVEDIESQRDDVVDGIERMREEVDAGAASVNDALGSLGSIVDRVDETAASVEEIHDATADQAESAQEVLAMTDEIAGIGEETTAETQTVSAAAQQQAASLDEVTDELSTLETGIARLETALAGFEVDRADGASETSPAESTDETRPVRAEPTSNVDEQSAKKNNQLTR
ncbi:methyl-accepting chemotaxis protein [Halogeometricum limi]|uniref:Methyl-accepting chemotaxis protein n=1 Tax=Halogeometricum limi TaxID=555875 RepID=A0A1I6I4J1_9EURY|nr:methyl-accepting chemotaxis protein [Halogeometricum limi]SFR61558.1 methyl-accepting chemotaxis protein [Halogeometricum limi]